MAKLAASLGCAGVLALFAVIIANFCAYIHSLIFCFNHLNQPNELIVLLVSILPPVGIIHGWLLWFGVVAV
jgi:hypothetical protein